MSKLLTVFAFAMSALVLASCDSPDDPPEAVGKVAGCVVYKLTTTDYRTIYVSKCANGGSGVNWNEQVGKTAVQRQTATAR